LAQISHFILNIIS